MFSRFDSLRKNANCHIEFWLFGSLLLILLGEFPQTLAAQTDTRRAMHERGLSQADSSRVEQLTTQLEQALSRKQFETARKAAEGIVSIRSRAQGADHWLTGDARRALTEVGQIAKWNEKQQSDWGASVRAVSNGDALFLKGRYAEARAEFERAFRLRTSLIPKSHFQLVRCEWKTAACLMWEGQAEKAEPKLKLATAQLAASLGEIHIDTAQCAGDWAFCLRRLGRLVDAVAAYMRQLRIYEEIDGPAHIRTAMAKLSLAYIYESAKRFDLAEPYLRQTLPIYEKSFGNKSQQVAQRHRHLAGVLDETGKSTEAETHFQQALAITKGLFGESSTETISALRDLASHYRLFGDVKMAIDVYGDALRIQRAMQPQDLLEIAQAEADLGDALLKAKRHSAASDHLGRSFTLFKEQLGETSEKTGRVAAQLAQTLNELGKYDEAERWFALALKAEQGPRRSGVLRRIGLMRDAAENLQSLDRLTEAEAMFRRSIEFAKSSLGEGHAETLFSNQRLLTNLRRQRKHEEAEQLTSRIEQQLLGASQLDELTRASACGSLSLSLRKQGRFDEAYQYDLEAVRLWRKLRGEDDAITRGAIVGLASGLSGQGRYTDSAAVWLSYLEQDLKAHGAISQQAFNAYEFVAGSMSMLGDWQRAEEIARQRIHIAEQLGATNSAAWREAKWAHAVYLGKLGIRDTEVSIYQTLAPQFELEVNKSADLGQFGRLAQIKSRLGKHDEAIKWARKQLTEQIAFVGKESSLTAQSRMTLATVLQTAGRMEQAEGEWREALLTVRERLGDDNPTTARFLSELGHNLYRQGRLKEAESFWVEAAESYDKSQQRIAPSGLERAAVNSQFVRRDLLAMLLAKRGAFSDATERLEQHLGRGLLDELAARRTIELEPADQRRQADLSAEMRALNQQKSQLASVEITPENRDDIQAFEERLELELLRNDREWKSLQAEFSNRYSTKVAEVYPLARIQKELKNDEALVAWIDHRPDAHNEQSVEQHWACVIRAQGVPRWIELKGSGSEGAWTDDDADLLEQFHIQVSKTGPNEADRRAVIAIADEVYAQRLQPLTDALNDHSDLPKTRHVIALASSSMNGIPLSALTSEYTFSRIPSGTILAMLRERSNTTNQAPKLLAVGNPSLTDGTEESTEENIPPDYGVLVQKVGQPSNARNAGLQAADIILNYGEIKLNKGDDLIRAIQLHAPKPDGPVKQKTVPLEVWRRGQEMTLEIRPGSMGIAFSQLPARVVWQADERANRLIRAARGGELFRPLPATRFELKSIGKSFTAQGYKHNILQQSDASEEKMASLVATGDIAQFRYLHFATHALVNHQSPLESFLILSSEPKAPRGLDALLGGKTDGRITAGTVLRDWKLNADLVALSACQSGLGRELAGEGFVGFSTAFLLAGSRCVLVSLWPVDDAATALLMGRFYESLLDADRPGHPIDIASALADAQRWLRELSREHAIELLKDTDGGVIQIPAYDRPFAHPAYWAAFTTNGNARHGRVE